MPPMFTIQQFVKNGLDRDIPRLAEPPERPLMDRRGANAGPFYPTLELAPGKRKKIPTDHKLGLPGWDARADPIPFDDNSIGEIHAYQFMEHLSGNTALALLREIERVLVPGGVFNMVTPYPGHGHFTQALDHKSMWTEETWNWLFGNQYYDDHEGDGWRLRVHTCFLFGVVYRNLDLFTQLVKGE